MDHPDDREALARQVAEDIFATLGTKWALDVLGALRDETLRFAQLQRALPEASQKMLTQTLKALETRGVVLREANEGFPRHVTYRVSPAGRALREQVFGLCAWSRRYLDEIAGATPPARASASR